MGISAQCLFGEGTTVDSDDLEVTEYYFENQRMEK